MPEAIGLLRQQHRNMVALLRALEWQVNEFEKGKQPDYDVISATMDYFLEFPDVTHHPNEERIFAKLRERDPSIAQQVGDLRIAHQELAARARDFATALRVVLQDAEVSREAVARWARGLIDLQRRHIDLEESAIFPAAAKALTAEDWSNLSALMTTMDDPLSNGQASDRFEKLRKTILDWQAEDQAPLTKQ